MNDSNLVVKEIIKKEVKIGNDGRQFILRIPTKVSNKSILEKFNEKYVGEVIIDPRKRNEIVVRLKKNGS